MKLAEVAAWIIAVVSVVVIIVATPHTTVIYASYVTALVALPAAITIRMTRPARHHPRKVVRK